MLPNIHHAFSQRLRRSPSGRVDHTHTHSALFVHIFPSLFGSYFLVFRSLRWWSQPLLPCYASKPILSFLLALSFLSRARLQYAQMTNRANAQQNNTHKQSTPGPLLFLHIFFLHHRAPIRCCTKTKITMSFANLSLHLLLLHHILHSSSSSNNKNITTASFPCQLTRYSAALMMAWMPLPLTTT